MLSHVVSSFDMYMYIHVVLVSYCRSSSLSLSLCVSYYSMNAEVLQAHPSILSSVSEHLYGFLDGFVNTRYTCILVDIHSTGTRENINIKHIYIVRDCTLYTVKATSALGL